MSETGESSPAAAVGTPGNTASSKTTKRKRGPEEQQGNATYTRRKALNACNFCRARKTKCDNALPICSFCRSVNGDCQYTKPSLSQYDQSTQTILQRLDSLEGNLSLLIQGTNNNSVSAEQRGLASKDTESTDFSPDAALNQPNLATVNNLEAPPKSTALLRASSKMSIEAMLQWPVFKRNLRSASSQCQSQVGDNRYGPQMRGQDDCMIQLDVFEPLVESFIANNLPCNPILDPVSLRQQMHAVVQEGLSWDGQSCLLLLVFALGSISSPADNPSSVTRQIDTPRDYSSFRAAEKYFWASQLRAGGLHCESHLLSAQCAFFAAVYLSFTMRTMAAWKAFAEAGTHCLAYLRTQESEVYDRPCGPGISSWETAEQRLRDDSLYWVILKGEAELCVELALPASALHECPYPHIFPRPPYLGSFPSGVNSIFEDSSDRNHFTTGWFYYLGEIALKRLQNRVLQHRFGSSKSETAQQYDDSARQDLYVLDDVHEFDEQLDQWLHHLPKQLQFSVLSTEDLRDHLRWVLRGHRLDVIELLRFPALEVILGRDTIETFWSHGLPPIALQRAREYLDNAVRRIEVHVEEFYHRHQGTWLTIRGCTRSALALLGTNLACEEDHALHEILLPVKWRAAVHEVLEMLRAWQAESPDVQHLQTIVESLVERSDLGKQRCNGI